MNRFRQKLNEHGMQLRRSRLETLQLNLGRKCNQACRHCHVDAAPWRTEMMSAETAARIASWIRQYQPPIIDITGGAPELNPNFGLFVELAAELHLECIDRNNLTILEEPGFEDLPQFLADHQVEIIASLPCYLEKNVNQQRGNGVFEKSIRALRKLNALGYGVSLPLHLVYNPLGPTLPPEQSELEADYKEALSREYGIVFNRLLTITNQPIARFAEDLRQRGNLVEYMDLLVANFNSATIPGLMCRNTLSVGYQGEIYDCDFNQMLGMQIGVGTPHPNPLPSEGRGDRATPVSLRDLANGVPSPLGEEGVRVRGDGAYLWDISPEDLVGSEILTGEHCFACTAGCGSSCTGALAA